MLPFINIEITLYKEVRYAVRIALTASTTYPVKYTSLMVRNLPKSHACKKEHPYQFHKATEEGRRNLVIAFRQHNKEKTRTDFHLLRNAVTQ